MKKFNLKKVLSILLAMLLTVQISGVFVKNVSADSSVTYLAFTSDIHSQCTGMDSTGGNKYAGSSLETLNNWINGVSDKLGGAYFEYFGSCGDMGYSFTRNNATGTSNYWHAAKTGMDVIEGNAHVGKGIYTLGNHAFDTHPGDYVYGTVYDPNSLDFNESVKARYIPVGEAANTEYFNIFTFGNTQWQEQYRTDCVAMLKTYLEEHGNEKTPNGNLKPVFIMAHIPLHQYLVEEQNNGLHNGVGPTNGATVKEFLNDYPNVIFLWGHNHSNNNSQYDKIHHQIDQEPITYTYCAAGCMSDEEYSTSTYASAKVIAKGLVAKVEDGAVTLTYYDVNANPLQGSEKVSYDNKGIAKKENADAKDLHVSLYPIKAATSAHMYRTYDVNVGVGKTLSFDIKNHDAGSVTYSVVSNNDLITTVSKSSVTVGDDGLKGAFSITGVADGVAIVSISAPSGSSNTVQAFVKVNVGKGIDGTGKYLVMNDGYVMTTTKAERSKNNSGAHYYDGFAGVKYNADKVDDTMLWTFTPYIDGYKVTNGGKYLHATYVNSNGDLFLTDTADRNTSWDFRDGYFRAVAATKTNKTSYSDKYLTFRNSTPSTPADLDTFIIRSISNGNQSSFLRYPDPCEHEYGNPVYTWSDDNKTVTAKVVCTKDSSHVLEEIVNTTSEEKEPTCLEAGSITYTATFTDTHFSKQEKTVEGKPATEHSYGTPTYTWSSDYNKCTAKVVCTKDSTHVVEETVDTVALEFAPTCEKDGQTVYTAEFKNSLFTKQTHTEDLKATGHNYEFKEIQWAPDDKSAKGIFVCKNDPEHVKEVAAKLEEEIIVKPEENKDGEKNITAIVEFEGHTYTDTVDGIIVPYTGVNVLPVIVAMIALVSGLAAVVFIRRKH